MALSLLGAYYHYTKFPFARVNVNYVNFALHVSVAYGYLRTFLINTNDIEAIKSICSGGLYLTPIVYLLAYFFANKKGERMNYNESKDFDVIETESHKSTKQTAKLKETVIDLIIDMHLKGVKAQFLKVD